MAVYVASAEGTLGLTIEGGIPSSFTSLAGLAKLGDGGQAVQRAVPECCAEPLAWGLGRELAGASAIGRPLPHSAALVAENHSTLSKLEA